MIGRHTLEHMRSRPRHERHAIATTTSFVVVALLLIVWMLFFFRSSTSDQGQAIVAQPVSADATSTQQ